MRLDPGPLWLTAKLAALTTAILLVLALPTAWWLAHTRSWLRYPARALANMPLVLPPSVLGFYLLLAFSPAYAFGAFLKGAFGIQLAFTFAGLVVGSTVFSFPFMLGPLLSGFEALPPSLSEASYGLGKGRRETFLRVLLPALRPSLLSGMVLTFAHTVGEFGVVMMIGGRIPGTTRVASVAIYDEVESLDYAAANAYALILFGLSFAVLLTVLLVNRRNLRTL